MASSLVAVAEAAEDDDDGDEADAGHTVPLMRNALDSLESATDSPQDDAR